VHVTALPLFNDIAIWIIGPENSCWHWNECKILITQNWRYIYKSTSYQLKQTAATLITQNWRYKTMTQRIHTPTSMSNERLVSRRKWKYSGYSNKTNIRQLHSFTVFYYSPTFYSHQVSFIRNWWDDIVRHKRVSLTTQFHWRHSFIDDTVTHRVSLTTQFHWWHSDTESFIDDTVSLMTQWHREFHWWQYNIQIHLLKLEVIEFVKFRWHNIFLHY